MKLSYPVSAPDSQVKVQAFCGEYEAAFEWLAEHGYAGVEILVRDPAALSVERLDGLLARWGAERIGHRHQPYAGAGPPVFTAPGGGEPQGGYGPLQGTDQAGGILPGPGADWEIPRAAGGFARLP